jgi:renierapurpurin 18,18'-hydroxylase
MLDKPTSTDDATKVDLRRVGSHPDHWYPVAWSRDLKPGKPYAARFAGEPLVVVRPAEGPVFALEDRCAHRQVPLSEGVVNGCAIRCGYHGWTYDASGKCVDVPYLGSRDLPNGVRPYPCREHNGLIFVWPGNPTAVTDLPSLGEAGLSQYKTRRFGKTVGCHYTFMHENLMDMNHQFLHRRTTGKVAPSYRGRRMGDDWLEVDYSFRRPAEKPPLGEAFITGALRGKSSVARDLMTVRTQYPYQTLRFWTGDGDPVLSVWLAYTPQDAEQKTNRSFIVLSVLRPKIPFVLDIAWPFVAWFTDKVFREDSDVVEMEQAAYDRQGEDWNQEIFPPILDLRKLLADNGDRSEPPAKLSELL